MNFLNKVRYGMRVLLKNPSVLGQAVSMNGLRYTVIGVMPKDFEFPLYADLWAAWMATPAEQNERVKRE